ncbi:hypothetical protein BSKO_03758 [Bryopsis sp. KO-2023]|nr:hypothetical protein BSKO_03758 [Bryopsis sp. KO-2023]
MTALTHPRSLAQRTASEMGDIDIDVPKDLDEDLNILWLLLGTYLVFFMQCGFALLEAGIVRAKNTKNILLKNVLDACVSTIIWWSVGYSFAFGERGAASNGFIGGTNFFMSNASDTNQKQFFAHWIFQWAFAATSGTIVSGAVAERCQFRAYLIYTMAITGFIYPVVVHWVWSGEGWLSPFRTEEGYGFFHDVPENLERMPSLKKSIGLIDFAGSGVVHMTGGSAALVAASLLGPRVGRFDASGVKEFPQNSVALATLGTFILWFGWYGFNPVSTMCMRGCMHVASKTAVNTTLSAAAGGIAVVLVHALSGNPADVSPVLNGILAGLVSITASCAVVEPYGAVIIGLLGGIIYYFSTGLLKRMRIDDPLDASPIHLFCGAWGVFAAGLFATPQNLRNAYGSDTDAGLFYGGNGAQLGVQILGMTVISMWSMFLSFILFFSLKVTGWLRVPKEEEIVGLDISHHGGSAYDYDDPKRTNTPGP